MTVLREVPEIPAGDDLDGASDLALLQRVAAEDRAAFEALYRRYYHRLFRYMNRMVRARETVEELVDDVMLVVWQKAGTFRGRSKVSTWVLGIAYHKAIRRLRKLASGPTLVSTEAAADVAMDEKRDPVLQRQMEMTLQSAVESLSPEQRAVMTLTFYYGYSYREIAEIVDCPVNTVKTRMFYARKRLQESWPELAAPLTGDGEEESG